MQEVLTQMVSANHDHAEAVPEVQKPVLEQRKRQTENSRRWRAKQDKEMISIRNTYNHIRQRCNNPNTDSYKNYGGRGIRVCARWNTFKVFYSDMGPRPSPKHQIDRIDNDGDYCPENCRWVDRDTQQRNKRNNHKLTLNGETLVITDWAARHGVGVNTIYSRLKLGWSVEDAITAPVQVKKRNKRTVKIGANP